jgi:ribulose-5-phosphate 4-epimerase/fuculose-1-phosphate aldolase
MKFERFSSRAVALMAAPVLCTAVLWAPVLPAQTGYTAPASGLDAAQVADLVLANHILANEGVLDGYGHVSVRDARNPNHFLLSRAAPAGAVTPADIVEYDLDANPVSDKTSVGYLERYIHAEIYKARPDVMAIIHTHAPEVIPFTVTGVPLRPMIHMAGFMPQDVPVFDNRKVAGMTDLLIRTPQLGQALAQALGGNPMILLRGHGAVVVAPSLHVVVGRAYYMAADAKDELQAITLAGGVDKVTFLAPEEADKAAAQDGFERAWAFWKSKLESK